MFNHGQMVMVIFSQSWSSLMVDPVILIMVRTWLIMVIGRALKFKKNYSIKLGIYAYWMS